MLSPSVRSAVTVVALAICTLSSCLLSSVRADDLPPGTPPEIARILRKVKSGQQPTMAEVQELQTWSQQLMQKANNPAAVKPTQSSTTGKTAAAGQGIPCTVKVIYDYTATAPGGYTEVCSLALLAKAVIYPRIDGTGDYYATLLNPSSHVSSFQVALPLQNGQMPKSGWGMYHKFSSSKGSTVTTDAHFDTTAATFTLTTTGRGDDLFGLGGVGGPLTGNTVGTDSEGQHTTPFTGKIGGDQGTDVPFAMESAGPKPGPGHATPKPTMHLSYAKLVAAINSGKTTTVTGSEAFSFTRGQTHYGGTTTLALVIRPKPLHLILEPASESDYQQWVPRPDAKECPASDLFGDPKPFQAHVALCDDSRPSRGRSSGGMTVPNAQQGGKLTVYLSDVSSEPGLCMNYPADPTTKEGLFFPKEQPAGITWVDYDHVETVSPTAREATVNVAARDTAAYGHILADCTNLGVQSDCPDTGQPYLTLPMDQNNNHIADDWEKEMGVYDKNLPADWDEEDMPSGWKTKGDGITLFEEYRGFLLENVAYNEEFRRLQPTKRKLFLYPVGQDRKLYIAGARLFTSVTGCETLIVHSADRLKPTGGQKHDRWINFNKTPYTKMAQCAVWMIDEDAKATSPGYTRNIFSDNDISPQCPSTIVNINISTLATVTQLYNWGNLFPPNRTLDKVPKSYRDAAANVGIDLTELGNGIRPRFDVLRDRLLIFVAMHEIGHAVGGVHHEVKMFVDYQPVGNTKQEKDADLARFQAMCYSSGDRACPMRYWHFDTDKVELLQFLSGKWDLTQPYGGGPWTFCKDDLPNLRIKP